jgi:hypothetical protein
MAAVTNTFTDTISISYTGNGKAVSTPIGSYSGVKDAGVATVVPAGSQNMAVAVNFPFATIQSCVISTDQDLTILVNSNTTPTETFNIKKTAGVVWGSDYLNACPFQHNVTTMYATNNGTTDAKLNLRVLYN